MTDLKIDYQLPDEVRASLGNLVAEFALAVYRQQLSGRELARRTRWTPCFGAEDKARAPRTA